MLQRKQRKTFNIMFDSKCIIPLLLILQ